MSTIALTALGMINKERIFDEALYISQFFLISVIGCGSDPLDDSGGSTTIQVFNASNYSIFVDCTTSGWGACDNDLIEPGNTEIIGVYGEISVYPGPDPESIFDEIMVFYDAGEGEYIQSNIIESSDWEVLEQQGASITYSTTIVDGDFFLTRF